MNFTKEEEALIAELEAVSGNFWAGEAEVVRTYFARHRTHERDRAWLRHQAWKEIKQIPVIANAVIEATPRVGKEISFDEYLEITKKCWEEAKHYVWVAECLEELEGKPLGPAAALDALGGPLPEQVQIRKVREEIEKKSRHPAVIAAVSTWPEGGGSGVTFKELSKVQGGKLEAKIAAAAARICAEEADHGREGAEAVIRGVRKCGLDAQTREIMLEGATRLCRQRLRMRNEMFGFPLTEERLSEIEAGTNVVLVRLKDLES
jgi:hypothetical protein